MPKSALGGTKIVELCQLVAGPYCTKLLSDLGAEVIKIEPPEGDPARKLPPFFHDEPDPEGSGLFLYLNTNKMGITLNLHTATGKDIFLRLVENADIMVEDNPPGTMEKLGLDYECLKEINPRLLMASITPFGQTGPYRDYKAYHLNVFHSSGEGYLTPGGVENMGRPPLKVGNLVGEYDSGLNAAIAILGALYYRKRSGGGQYIDISKQESVMSLNRLDMPRWANEGEVITRAKLGVPYGGALPCKDGYTVFVTWEGEQWDKLVDFMGHPEWTADEKFKDYASRYQNGELINALLTEWLVDYGKEELYHRGQAAEVPFAMVYTPQDLAESEQLEERGFFIEVEHSTTGKIKYPGVPYNFSRTPVVVQRPAPLLGEHNEEILTDRLGFDKEELPRLGMANVI